MLFEHVIRGPVQSGKTEIVLGFLERLHSQGIPVLYVAFSEGQARLMSQRRTVVLCLSIWQAVHSTKMPWRAVAVDDSDRCAKDDIEFLRQRLKALSGLTQLLLVETS